MMSPEQGRPAAQQRGTDTLMARTTITFDSATPEQVYNLTLAFQRTVGFGLPKQITVQPTVTAMGTAMGWTSPALRPEHAQALLREFFTLEETNR